MKKKHFYYDMTKETYDYVTKGNILRESKKEKTILDILFKDYNNSDIMQELQLQDEKYLKTIINQNNEILTLLRKEDRQCTKS